jgi:hypothetical protein
VIRGQLNSAVRQQAGRFDDCDHIVGRYPHLGFWSARLPEGHCFLTRTAMPIDDPELPLGFKDCRDGARHAELIRDAVKGIGEEHLIDRFRYDRIAGHSIRYDKLAVGRVCRRNERSRAVKHDRIDVDGVDAIGDVSKRGREQSVTATKINRDHTGLHAYCGQNPRGIGPQRVPPIGIGHRCCGKKPPIMPVLIHAWDCFLFDLQLYSITLMIAP